MKQLLHTTTVYRDMSRDQAQTVLVIFPDAACLRPLLRECAKALFGAGEGSREADLIEREQFSDCLFFPAEGKKITSEDCARIGEECLLSPVEGEKKLFVLDRFEDASAVVQNKLLKLLEEPPRGVYFLLGTGNEYAVLPTVRSRAKCYTLPPFPDEAIAAALLRMHPERGGQACREAAVVSGGIFTAAQEVLAGGGEAFRLAEQFLSAEDGAAFCRSLSDYPDKRTFYAALALVLRDMLFFREGQERHVLRKGVRALAARYPSEVILRALERVRTEERRIQFNANFGQSLLALAAELQQE